MSTQPLPSEVVAHILDNVSKGLTLRQISKLAEVAPSTVLRVLEAFPLWGFLRGDDYASYSHPSKRK